MGGGDHTAHLECLLNLSMTDGSPRSPPLALQAIPTNLDPSEQRLQWTILRIQQYRRRRFQLVSTAVKRFSAEQKSSPLHHLPTRPPLPRRHLQAPMSRLDRSSAGLWLESWPCVSSEVSGGGAITRPKRSAR